MASICRRGDRRVFDGLSCGFPRAQITVVLGGSGAGKTTMLRLIGGLSRPDSGSVYVADEDVTRLSERELFRTRASASGCSSRAARCSIR